MSINLNHRSPMWVRVAAVVLLGLIFLSFTVRGFDLFSPNVVRSDARADWLVTKAFLEGEDPYQDVYELSREFDAPYLNPIEEGEADLIHPRTPGALVLQSPLGLVDHETASDLMVVTGIIAMIASVAVLVVRFDIPDAGVIALSTCTFGFSTAVWALIFMTQSPHVMLLLAVAVALAAKGDSIAAGVLIAIAGTLKVFPFVLLVPLLVWKRKWSAAALVGVAAGLNLLPLMLPHVSPTKAIEGLRSSISNWFDIASNQSVASFLNQWFDLGSAGITLIQILILTLGVSLVVVWKSGAEFADWSFILSLSLLASPLFWPHYVLAVIPPLTAALSTERFGRLSLILVGIAALATAPFEWVEAFGPALILIAVATVPAVRRIALTEPTGVRPASEVSNL